MQAKLYRTFIFQNIVQILALIHFHATVFCHKHLTILRITAEKIGLVDMHITTCKVAVMLITKVESDDQISKNILLQLINTNLSWFLLKYFMKIVYKGATACESLV